MLSWKKWEVEGKKNSMGRTIRKSYLRTGLYLFGFIPLFIKDDTYREVM